MWLKHYDKAPWAWTKDNFSTTLVKIFPNQFEFSVERSQINSLLPAKVSELQSRDAFFFTHTQQLHVGLFPIHEFVC